MCNLIEWFCVILERLKSQMAALVAWLVGTIAGAKGEDKEDQITKDPDDKNKAKVKKGRHKAKKSPTREPSFSTTLTTPIEEVIEETLNEETTSGESVETKPAKKRNKKKKARSTEHIDDFGFPFSRTKSVEITGHVDDSGSSLARAKSAEIVRSQNSPESEDTLGFSFLPVKRHSRKKLKPKIDDLPKSSLIEHYQSKESKKNESPIESKDDFVVVEKPKTNESRTKSQDNRIEIVNKPTGKVVYLEAKESKKVHSKISYASVASQGFDDLERLLKEEAGFDNGDKPVVNPISEANPKEDEKPIENQPGNSSATPSGYKASIGTSRDEKEDLIENKNEELVSEIASEERRLVDLLEGTKDKRDGDFLTEERLETERHTVAQQGSSDIKTVDDEDPTTNQYDIDDIINEDCQGIGETTITESEEIVVTHTEPFSKCYKRTKRQTVIVDLFEEQASRDIYGVEPIITNTIQTIEDNNEEVDNNIDIERQSSLDVDGFECILAKPESSELIAIQPEEIDTENIITLNEGFVIEDKDLDNVESVPTEIEVTVTPKSEETGTINIITLDESPVIEDTSSKIAQADTNILTVNEVPAIEESTKDTELNGIEFVPTTNAIKDTVTPNTEETDTFDDVTVNEVSSIEDKDLDDIASVPSKIEHTVSLKGEETEDTKILILNERSVIEDSTEDRKLDGIESVPSTNAINDTVAPETEETDTFSVVIVNEEFAIEDTDLDDLVSVPSVIEDTQTVKSEETETIKITSNEPSVIEYSTEIRKLDDIESLPTTNAIEDTVTPKIEETDAVSVITLNQGSVTEDSTQDIGRVTEVDNSKATPKPFKMSSGTQVRVLTLNDKEHQDSVLYRIEKNWILQFRLGPSLLGRKVSLYCNYPKTGDEFNRNLYHLLQWSQDEGCNYSDDTALLTEITPTISGSFHYYFTYENAEEEGHQGSGFFLVDPVLKYGNDERLLLDCIQCQTVLAKGLGPFDTWEDKLRVTKESGYNMIHFTPIQELGASNSSYSLSEQLKVNSAFTKKNGEETTFQDIENLVTKIRNEWKVASICDIVLNHTANESEWLKEHPEVTYNCQNCPYMRPSYLLDAALHQFSLEVANGLYEDKGIPIQVSTEEHLGSIRHYLRTEVLTKAKIHELFICDVSGYIVEFLDLARIKVPSRDPSGDPEDLKVVQDPQFRRFGSTVDMQLAVKLYNVYRSDCFDEETRIKRCAADFKSKLEALNGEIVDKVDEHLKVAVENVVAGIRYFRVQHDGPKIPEVTVKTPLISRYFTDYRAPKSFQEHEDVMYGDDGRFLMAHNGWVMNSDPLRNFAAAGSYVYLRRELIAWGDSVKLRYGEKPQDCPFLWNHMKTYVEQTARIFDGVRLDNCHSTPIPVAEYLLDCARTVKPDLYVVAELFTNSDLTDNVFVNRLGITSLIREAMSAWDSHEEGRLVYRYGGSPVGSFYQPRVRPMVPSIAHALFLDLTHDNPSPIEKRSVFDLLPSTALVNMACCASGSNRGYDELVPHHIHVVDETRQYTEWAEDDDLATGNSRYVTKKSGIIAAKKALNDLHYHLGLEGFDQVYVDQMDADVVAVTRHCPDTHQSYVLVAFTAFGHPSEDAAKYQRGIRPLRVEGVLDEIVLEATLNHISVKSNQESKYTKFHNFQKDTNWINGLSEYQVHLKEHLQPPESEIFERVDSGTENVVQLNFKNFKPGSIAVIKVSLPEDMDNAVKNIRSLIAQFSLKKDTELRRIISEMTLADLNRALCRCGEEERDEGHGFDTYNIPNFGSLVYAGLQGFMSVLSNIRPSNDLGHPMCANLRDGNWMIDYIWKRLKLDDGTINLGQWIEENTKSLKQIPRYLIPCYLDVIVTGIYVLLLEQSFCLMSNFVRNGSAFVKSLSLGSLQCAARIKSADLPTLSPNLAEPKPLLKKNDRGELVQACVTLSAGLPHFSVGYMRNWGRDTFIALRGLFLLTGRHQEARYHILGYGGCLRHGLVPNLLDGGRNPRFNCRDAIWWWLYCIKCYVDEAGASILRDAVARLFPAEGSPPEQPLHDVMQEALDVHFQGLVFRERNAGRQIDEHMTDQGFDNQIGVHPETGFVFGGNPFNCGTWMDKMGSSQKAGNRGKPATPRDGSAVELIGLSKAVVTWLAKLSKEKVYPYDGVRRTHKNGNVTKWTFQDWAQKIQSNFEKCFWVNIEPVSGEIRPDLINKRGIYKDCYGASQEWTDFQLRCNFPVAMVVAPELFDPRHAWVALQQAEKYLLGPLGMKTLDPEDWAYNGNYDNSNDSDNPNLAHGFNYHQGPEWVWPVGFYLRAGLQFAAANGELDKTIAKTKVVLSKHFVELQTSPWRGLPELTNQNGSYCRDSSRTQAWSMSCILEVLHDLQQIEKKQPLIN